MNLNDRITVALASDHAGYLLKEALIKHLNDRGIDTIDCGTNSAESCDYPDYAVAGCCKVLDGHTFAAILDAVGAGSATLEGTVLTLDAYTSVVLS